MCAIKPSYNYCAPQLCQTAARHFEGLSMSDGRIGPRKQVNERTSACWDNFASEKVVGEGLATTFFT